MQKPTKILAFHLLNDLSGSPKVLSQLLKGWVALGYEVHLYTSANAKGFLSNIEGVQYHSAWYKFSPNKWIRLFFYSLSQLLLFVKIWGEVKKTDIVYVNTVLPFAAGIVGRLKRAKVLYHIHESTVSPAILKWFLFKMVKINAREIINVSKYVAQAHKITEVPNHLLYNTLEEDFLQKVKAKETQTLSRKVLMVCSLKVYKGVFEFVQLARDNPNYEFRLVLNATQDEIENFFSSTEFPANFSKFPSQKDLHSFYFWADVILNLSLPEQWIETFGLTIIEGMAYGLPAIVPPVGGILEVIEEGKTGYSVNAHDRELLNEKLRNLLENEEQYLRFSAAAKARVSLFQEAELIAKSNEILQKIAYQKF